MLGIYFAFMLVLSATNIYLVRALDIAMDYTNVLDFIRLRRAKRIDKFAIEGALKKVKCGNMDLKVQELADTYLNIVQTKNSKFLKSIICMSCMTMRINLIIQFALSLTFYLCGVNIIYTIFGLIASVGLNWFIYERSE